MRRIINSLVIILALSFLFGFKSEIYGQICSGSTLCCYPCGAGGTCDYLVPQCNTSGGSCSNDPGACLLGDTPCGGNCGWTNPPGNPTPTPGACKVCEGPGNCNNTGYPNCDSTQNECNNDCDCDGGGNCNPTPTPPSCTYSAGACGSSNECQTDEKKYTETTPLCNPDYYCQFDSTCRPAVCIGSIETTDPLNIGTSTTITVTGNPPESTITQFWLAFYNIDNSTQGIWFQSGVHHILKKTVAECGSSTSCSFTINWADLNYPDLNWGGQKPVHVQVNGYFVLADGGFSVADSNCVQSFTVQQNTNPTCTVTPNGTQNVCLNSVQSYTANCSDSQTGIATTTIYTSSVGAAPNWNTICSDTDGSCTGNKTWSTAGNYWVTVNGTDSVTYSACSGNPWCEWEPIQATQTTCAPGFANCSVGTDTLLVAVSGSVGTPTLNTPTTGCPGPPDNVTPQANLSWSSGSCATSYQVYRCDATNSPGCTPGSLVATVTGTSTTNNVPNPTHNYRYRVRACNGATCSAYSAIQEVGPFMIPPATSPVTASCTNGNPEMTIGWGTGVCVEQYNLQRCENATGACTSGSTWILENVSNNNGNPITYIDTGPFQSDYYYSYRLQSCTNGSCASPSSITTAQNICPTCSPLTTFIVPPSPTSQFVNGYPQSFITQTTDPSITIDSVDYSSSGTGGLSFAPSHATPAPFSTSATGTSGGTAQVVGAVNLLEPGGTVVPNACTISTNSFPVYLASCTETINGGSPIQVSAGTTEIGVPIVVNTTTTPAGGTALTNIQGISCTVSDPTIADFCADPATVCPTVNIDPLGFQGFDLTGNTNGTASVTCTALIEETSSAYTVATCSQNSTVTVFNESWWKSEGGDVITNSSIRSCIPSTAGVGQGYLIDGSTTLIAPGVLGYSDTQAPALCNGSISSITNYRANTIQKSDYDFDYYWNKLPTDFFTTSNIDFKIEAIDLDGNPATCPKSFDGYCWYLYDGNDFGGAEAVVSEDITVGSGRIILFVRNATLRFDYSVTLTEGNGFVMILNDQNMLVSPTLGQIPAADPTTATLEGIYVANSFTTETVGVGTPDSQFVLRGVLYAQNIFLNRDLFNFNDTLASEYFIYDPAAGFLMPDGLKDRRTFFREIAP